MAAHVFWDQDAEKFVYDRWLRTATARFDQQETGSFLQRAFQCTQGSLLEVGCGPGFWLHQAAVCSYFSRKVGIDRSQAMVMLAREAGIEAHVADAHHLPFEDASFDAVMSIHVLEYSPNPELFLQEAKRVLRPGGRYCLITKNRFGRPWQWARKLSERIAPNPLSFHCLLPEDISSVWGSAPVDSQWISARLITDLNDVNDAVHLALPAWMEISLLWLAHLLRPILRRDPFGKFLAWHLAVILEKPLEQ